MVLEPYLEGVLSRLFGMRVTIVGLQADVVAGEVRADLVRFWNQAEFQRGPHLEVQGMHFDLDIEALFDKKVIIEELKLNKPYYFIDRIATPQGGRNNVITWYRHMKTKIKKKDKPPKKRWLVDIRDIRLIDGTFIFQDRSSKEERKYVFTHLDGYLRGLRFPSPSPSVMTQKVMLRGFFGEVYPAPVHVWGVANFVTKDVSFHLKGNIPDGDLREHQYLWKNLAVKIENGRFRLHSRVTCHRKMMKSTNLLTLSEMDIAPASNMEGRLWGYPTMVWINFVEEEKELRLIVPVVGRISDPDFQVDYAFSRAFQEALRRHTKSSIDVVTFGPRKLAEGTGMLAKEAPLKLFQGLGKVSSVIKEQTFDRVMPGGDEDKDEEQ